MGKKLIISGADFSENAIPNIRPFLHLETHNPNETVELYFNAWYDTTHNVFDTTNATVVTKTSDENCCIEVTREDVGNEKLEFGRLDGLFSYGVTGFGTATPTGGKFKVIEFLKPVTVLVSLYGMAVGQYIDNSHYLNKFVPKINYRGNDLSDFSRNPYAEEVDISGLTDEFAYLYVRFVYTNTRITNLDCRNITCANATTLTNMFAYNSILKTIDLSNFNPIISAIASYSGMFTGCDALEKIIVTNCTETVRNWLISRLADAGKTFIYNSATGTLDKSV